MNVVIGFTYFCQVSNEFALNVCNFSPDVWIQRSHLLWVRPYWMDLWRYCEGLLQVSYPLYQSKMDLVMSHNMSFMNGIWWRILMKHTMAWMSCDEYQNIPMVYYLAEVGGTGCTPTDRVLGW